MSRPDPEAAAELARLHAALGELERTLVALRAPPPAPEDPAQLLSLAESLAIIDAEVARIERMKGYRHTRDAVEKPLPPRLPDGRPRCQRAICPEPATTPKGYCAEHGEEERRANTASQRRMRALRRPDPGYCVECWDDHKTADCPRLAPRKRREQREPC